MKIKGLFLLVLSLFVFFLAGCSDNGDYEVTEDEFVSAVNFEGINNFRATGDKDGTKYVFERYDTLIRVAEYVDGEKTHEGVQKAEGYDFRWVSIAVGVDAKYLFELLVYNKSDKLYFTDSAVYDEYIATYKIKFNNKKLTSIEVLLKQDGIEKEHFTVTYEYDCVEEFENPNYLLVQSDSMSWNDITPLEEWNDYEIKGFSKGDKLYYEILLSENKQNLKIGDVVTYINEVVENTFSIYSHRIVDIIKNTDGEIESFIVQGDKYAATYGPYVGYGTTRYNVLIASGTTDDQINRNNFELIANNQASEVKIKDVLYIITSVKYKNNNE